MSASLAIVGAADTEVGVVPGKSPTELCVEAALEALADAGLAKDAVGGLILHCRVPPSVEVNDMGRRGQRQSRAACLQGQDEERNRLVLLKGLDQ